MLSLVILSFLTVHKLQRSHFLFYTLRDKKCELLVKEKPALRLAKSLSGLKDTY